MNCDIGHTTFSFTMRVPDSNIAAAWPGNRRWRLGFLLCERALTLHLPVQSQHPQNWYGQGYF